jgi:hypothetical protein
MPFTPDETTAYNRLTANAVGAAARCGATATKWNNAVVIRGGVVHYSTPNCFSGADSYRNPGWVHEFATNNKSEKDAEVKALCYITDKVNLAAGDLVVIYGADGPCQSCRNVIHKWARYNRVDAGIAIFVTVIYYVAAYTSQPGGVWPLGCLYGHANPITDMPGLYYYRP